MRNPWKTPRIAAAAALAVGMLMAFAALGGVGLAQTSISAGQYQYGKKKVTVCHKGKKTKRVPKAAVPAHLRHGDTLGPCSKEGKKARKHGKSGKGQKGHKGEKAHKGEKSHEQRAESEQSKPRKERPAKEKSYEGEHPGKGKRGKGK